MCKYYIGFIFLVGGLVVFVVVFSYLVIYFDLIFLIFIYLFCVSVLLVIGVFDDLYDISFWLRLLV